MQMNVLWYINIHLMYSYVASNGDSRNRVQGTLCSKTKKEMVL